MHIFLDVLATLRFNGKRNFLRFFCPRIIRLCFCSPESNLVTIELDCKALILIYINSNKCVFQYFYFFQATIIELGSTDVHLIGSDEFKFRFCQCLKFSFQRVLNDYTTNPDYHFTKTIRLMRRRKFVEQITKVIQPNSSNVRFILSLRNDESYKNKYQSKIS